MENPGGKNRNYFAGSAVTAFSHRVAGRITRFAGRFPERAAAWTGAPEILSAFRANPFRVFCVFLASAITANGLTLCAARVEIAPWGVALRLIGLGLGLLGLFSRNDWHSLRETSFLIRFVRIFQKRAWR